MGTGLDKNGGCVATTDQFSPPDYASAENAAHMACLNTLIPKRPVPVLQTPGSFFAGYAWGSKSKQFIYGPQVGVGAAILVPLHRPSLVLTAVNFDRNNPVIPTGSTFTFKLPDSMTFAAALAFSLNANLAAFTFPNAPASVTTSGTTQASVNVGIYVAPQLGWEWWDTTGAKSVMFSLGVLAGYINTDATGGAFTIGIQPGLVAQF